MPAVTDSPFAFPALQARLAALELRAEADRASPAQSLLLLEHRINQLRAANNCLEASQPQLEEVDEAEAPAPIEAPVPWRVRRQLLRGRDLVEALRTLLPTFASREVGQSAAGLFFKETQTLADFALLSARQWSPTTGGQPARLAEGLQAAWEAVESRVLQLRRLSQRWDEAAELKGQVIAALQDVLFGRPVTLDALRPVAHTLLEDARAGLPWRQWYCDAQRPLSWAAAAGLNTAVVLSRLLDADSTSIRPVEQLAAALLMDVGMARLPSRILGKDGPLTDEDRRQVEGHPEFSYDLLRTALPGEPELFIAAREHHEQPSGIGYPHGKSRQELTPLGQRLAVCSAFAARLAPRPWRAAQAADAAVAALEREANQGRWSTETLMPLAVVATYPVGSLLELEDGRIAQVLTATRSTVAPLLLQVVHTVGPESGPLIGTLQLDRAAVRRGISTEQVRSLAGLHAIQEW